MIVFVAYSIACSTDPHIFQRASDSEPHAESPEGYHDACNHEIHLLGDYAWKYFRRKNDNRIQRQFPPCGIRVSNEFISREDMRTS